MFFSILCQRDVPLEADAVVFESGESTICFRRMLAVVKEHKKIALRANLPAVLSFTVLDQKLTAEKLCGCSEASDCLQSHRRIVKSCCGITGL